jgi:hypothetical protein
MRGFWWEYCGEKIYIIFSLIENGRYWHSYKDGQIIGVEFDYPPAREIDDETVISIGAYDLREEMDSEVRSMLFQTLGLNASEIPTLSTNESYT